MKISSKPINFWIPLGLISALGFILVWYTTVWGAGLISDSFQYVASARSLAAGQTLGYPDENGNTVPLTQYPPLFPVILAAFEIAGVDGLDAARLMNAALFAVNIGLVGISIRKISNSIGFSLLGSLLTALSIVLIEAHTWVLSEPLFVLFCLLAFYWLGLYFETSGRRWLLASALAGSLALLTRYVGIALLPAALIVIWWKSNTDRRRKWIDLGVYSLVDLLPMTIWSVRNYLQSGQINNRSLQWIPLTAKNINSLINTIFTWFIPESLVNGRERWAIPVLVILFIGLGLVLLFGKQKIPSYSTLSAIIQRPLFLLHGIYIPFYFAMVIASKMLFDNNIGMTDRMFSPIFVSMIIPGSVLFSSLWLYSKNLIRLFLLVTALYLVVYFAIVSAPVVAKFHRQGIGLARKTWQTSLVIQSLPDYASLPIYSNSPSTLYFWTGRTGAGVLALEQLINSGFTEKAVLVVFYHIPTNNRINRLEQKMILLKSDPMATIYMYEP